MHAKPPGGKVWLILHLGVVAAASITIAAALSGRAPQQQQPETRRAEAPATRAEVTPASEPEKPLATRMGLASYYGSADNKELFAAHPSYARGTLVRVTNLKNGREVVVRISDRGPTAGKQAEGLIIDLSRAAAAELDFIRAGIVRVRVEVIKWGKRRGEQGA